MDTIEADFRERGFGGTFAFFQGLGGGITRDRARAFPLALYGSGPAAGAIGANQLARAMDAKNVLVGDMGGTSFDTCFISDNNIQIRKNTEFGRFMTYVNIADVVSIGAGGGSIAWVSERGVPQVGPQSARSTPGPACYGRGGMEPTVTDAMVALGFIDPDHYLGGRVRIHPDLAKSALDGVLSDRFGWTTETSATAVHDLVVTNMALALREVSVVKGKDPRDAIFLAYGGCLPLFCCEIADRLGIREVIVPADSSVFSGRGLLSADFKLRSDRTLMWNFDDLDRLAEINQEISEFVDGIVADLAADGFDPARFRVERHADLKYSGQVFELSVPMPDVITEDTVPVLDKEFRRLYEQTYGSGAAWEGVVPTMTTYTVTVTAGSEGDATEALFRQSPLAVGKFGPAPRSRSIYLPSERRMSDVPIYDAAAVAPGQYGVGPLVIDSVDTTIFVPTGVKVERDTFRNWRLSV